jgi:hypothetical protein
MALDDIPASIDVTARPAPTGSDPTATNALPKLREKAMADVHAGAREAWLVYPESRSIEIDGAEGRLTNTAFDVDPASLFWLTFAAAIARAEADYEIGPL